MANNNTTLVIKEHDFLEAKNKLKVYAETTPNSVDIDKVDINGGFFGLGDHKVTGSELNDVTEQIQDLLVKQGSFNIGLLNEFREIYNAFESLDKDYISGIVTSIKAAEKVSMEEQKDRANIKATIDKQEKTVAVLKKFKDDIDKLKHITDVDKVWEIIEDQRRLTDKLNRYIKSLSAIDHLGDVDGIYTELSNCKNSLSAVMQANEKMERELQAANNFFQTLSRFKHIKDVDNLWQTQQAMDAAISNMSNTLEIYIMPTE